MGKLKEIYNRLVRRKPEPEPIPIVSILNDGGYIDPSAQLIGEGVLEISEGSEVRANAILEFGGGKLTLGKNSVIGYGCFIQVSGEVSLADGVLIGPNSCLIASNHGVLKTKKICEQPLVRGEIVIEEDVWVGANVTIGFNTHIGKGAIVGANAFVNKDIPSGEVWAGVPCRKINNR